MVVIVCAGFARTLFHLPYPLQSAREEAPAKMVGTLLLVMQQAYTLLAMAGAYRTAEAPAQTIQEPLLGVTWVLLRTALPNMGEVAEESTPAGIYPPRPEVVPYGVVEEVAAEAKWEKMTS